MTEITKILGRPGTGKTYTTLDLTEEEFEKGVDADDLLYFSYTVAASEEGKERIAKRIGCDPDELGDNWRTIHSECFHLLNLNPVQTADNKKRKDFCEEIGVNYSMNQDTEDASEIEKQSPGNEFFSAYDWLRSRMRDIDELDGLFSFKNVRFDPKKFMRAWEAYKKENGLVDFQDMLSGVLRYNLKPEAEVMIVDEFQDLTPLQYEVYKLWRDEMERVYIAGDPAQAIYTFGGANPHFLVEEKSEEKLLLDQTYRLPSKVWKPSRKILESLHNVEDFAIEPTGEGGEFKYLDSQVSRRERGFQDMRLVEELKNSLNKGKDSMILFRTRSQAQSFENIIAEEGIPYKAMRGFEIWTKRMTNLRNGILELINDGETSRRKKRAVTTLLGKDMHEGRKEKYRFIERIKQKTGFELPNYQRTKKQEDHPLNYYQAKALVANLENDFFTEPALVRVGTKHSAKGKEANTVITTFDSSKKIAETMYLQAETEDEYAGVPVKEKFIDDREKRVDFVAMTRASEKLVVSESAFAKYPSHTLEQLQKETPEEVMNDE